MSRSYTPCTRVEKEGIPKEEKRKVMGRGGAGGRGEIPLKDLIEPPSLGTSSGARERLASRFYAPENPCTQPRTAGNKYKKLRTFRMAREEEHIPGSVRSV